MVSNMSNIIKKCPNCGKLMDVDFNKDKVICPNCKKIFLIYNTIINSYPPVAVHLFCRMVAL